MTNEEILSVTVLKSWKLVISRFDKVLSELSDEQLQRQVAPGKNRVFYLVGHLIVTHDWIRRISRIRTECLSILFRQLSFEEHGPRSIAG